MTHDTIPAVETYRGVDIHDRQPPERVEDVVKPAIDAVFGLSDAVALAAYAADSRNPPEARLFAAARCEAAWQFAANDRSPRPAVNMDRLRACVAGLDSVRWRHPFRFTTLLDPYDTAPLREQPLPAKEQTGQPAKTRR